MHIIMLNTRKRQLSMRQCIINYMNLTVTPTIYHLKGGLTTPPAHLEKHSYIKNHVF